MSIFSADWLALREPFDRSARAASDAAFDWPALAGVLRPPAGAPVGVLDLACGTGANLRALAPRLGGAQRWLLVDHDPALLDAVPAVLAAWAGQQGMRLEAGAAGLRLHGDDGLEVDIERRCVDLAGRLDALPWAATRLVTASALLDLVAVPWLEAVVAHCRAAGAAVLWALSADARIAWWPADPQDGAVHASFAAHQRRDKGLGGAALGAEAAERAASLLAAAGYRVTRAPSDWHIDAALGRDHAALLRAMIEGIADAAAQQSPALSPTVAEWMARRLAQAAGSRLRVGHQDLLALP
jgi:SAM-dependent methyltransferase